MSFGDEIGKEFEKINKKRDRVIKSATVNLAGDLIEGTPVGNPDNWKVPRAPKGYTGGELKHSWQPPKQLGRAKYVITNIAPHALVIDGGRREVPTANGLKEIGSKQLVDGFKPIIKKTEKKIERAFNK